MTRWSFAALLVFSSMTAFGAPCLPGTLQDYLGLAAGCEAGDVLLNNFQVAPGQAVAAPIDPSDIQVVPGGTQIVPSLMFVVNRAALGGEVFGALIRFTASAGLLSGAAIWLDGAAAGDGAVIAILDVCAGGSFAGSEPVGCSGTPAVAIAAITASDVFSDSLTAVNSFFDIFVDLSVDGGLAGSASLTSATVSITSVPEPAAGVLTAVALALIGVLRTRRNH